MRIVGVRLGDQKGLALISLVIGLFLAVGAMFIYAASFYQEMNEEVERMKRNIGGISLMQQLATFAHRARQVHQQNPGACPPGTFQSGPFCFDDARGSCIENAFDLATPLCIDSPENDGVVDRVLVTRANLTPSEDLLKTIEQKMIAGTYRLGEWVLGWVDHLGTQAIAQAPNVDMPDLSAVPAPLDIDLTPTNCPPGGAPAGSATCLKCNTAGTGEHGCIVFKVCVRSAGLGGCDDAIDGQWLWQTVLVTDPVVVP